MHNQSTNPFQPRDKASRQDGLESTRRPLGKRIVIGLFAVLGITAAGPAIWLLLLVAFGLANGEPLRVFRNHLIWEDEFVAKAPIAVVISILPALQVGWEILTEKERADRDGH